MKIDLHYGLDPGFGPTDHEELGIGGTENFITYVSEYLARAGQDVRVYNKLSHAFAIRHNDTYVDWLPLERFDPWEHRDVLVSFRTRDIFEQQTLPHTKLRVLALADTESYGLGDAVRAEKLDLVIAVGYWQAEKICEKEEKLKPEQYMVSSNGVSMYRFDQMRDVIERQPGKCIHLATPERGLQVLLDLWPRIENQVPEAELHLFSSFIGWKVPAEHNENMAGDVYRRIEAMQNAGRNIVNHKHANAREIRRHLLQSRLYLYPTRHFDETCCISALEASAAGVPIVATARAALLERVDTYTTGYLVWDDEAHDKVFINDTVRLLKEDALWQKMSEASIRQAQQFDYATIVDAWLERWRDALDVRR